MLGENDTLRVGAPHLCEAPLLAAATRYCDAAAHLGSGGAARNDDGVRDFLPVFAARVGASKATALCPHLFL